LSDASCFGFLSFAIAGAAAVAETSAPSENASAKERAVARNDLGIAEISGKDGEARRSSGLMALSCLACSGTEPSSIE
jgi:hypothetical protein